MTFNAIDMTISVSPHRLDELTELCQQWTKKLRFTRVELEQLIGKLQFVTSCVRPGRIFLSRLLNALRETNRSGTYDVTHQMKKDISWWLLFLPHYNGVLLLWPELMMNPDAVLSSDASGVGMGGYLVDKQYFHL